MGKYRSLRKPTKRQCWCDSVCPCFSDASPPSVRRGSHFCSLLSSVQKHGPRCSHASTDTVKEHLATPSGQRRLQTQRLGPGLSTLLCARPVSSCPGPSLSELGVLRPPCVSGNQQETQTSKAAVSLKECSGHCNSRTVSTTLRSCSLQCIVTSCKTAH